VQQERGGDRRRDVIPDSVAAPRGPQWPADLVALYSAERTSLVRAAFLICGSAPAAEDAVHDAVGRVATRWSGVENGRSYLYTAVVNAARDGARRESRVARLFERRRESDAYDDTATLSAESMALRAALARLPVNQRAAIVLRYFLDWDDDEIARRYDVRPATVRSWLHRGMTRMQRDWER
jgi:RNA polymerase sigma factor (sigma-70 family)